MKLNSSQSNGSLATGRGEAGPKAGKGLQRARERRTEQEEEEGRPREMSGIIS